MQVALTGLRADGYAAAILWTLANYPQGQRFYEGLGWQASGFARHAGREIQYRHTLTSPVS